MFRNFCEWLDQRTGYRKGLDILLLKQIPAGSKWRYTWGSALAFVFLIELLTGVLLMLRYSPGESTAWGSVYFIQYEMDFGWLVRGLHYFGSQLLIVLLVLHLLQMVISGAHLSPREFSWWTSLSLMLVILGLTITGHLLPWDQNGFYGTQVRTGIAGNIPIIGGILQRVVVGGPEFGHQTLTQFYTLHVAVLSPLALVLVIAYLYVFRRQGIVVSAGPKNFEYFWPAQAFKDTVVCLAVFAVLMGIAIFVRQGKVIDSGIERSSIYEDWAKAGQKGFGAALDAPADRETPEYPARPEWHFLFLFQLLKYFTGDLFLVGTVYIPTAVLLLLFALPLLGYGKMRKFGHALGIVLLVALLGAMGGLTFLAIVEDATEPVLGYQAGDAVFGIGGGDEKKAEAAREKAGKFRHDLEDAEKMAARAVQLAHQGIPQEGANLLLRHDPLTRGPKVFQANCAACHSHASEPAEVNGKGDKAKKTASDLTDFGKESWIRGLLRNPSDPKYFGLVQGKVMNETTGKEEDKILLMGMIGWRAEIDKNRKRRKMKEEAIQAEERDLDHIARFLAEQAKPKHERDPQVDKEGRKLFMSTCARCHGFEENRAKFEKGAKGPDLTDYGSADWLRTMIMSPAHKSRYGALSTRNFMPAYRPMEGPEAQVPLQEFIEAFPQLEKEKRIMNLSDIDREILIRWMTNDYRVVFGGQTISGVKK